RACRSARPAGRRLDAAAATGPPGRHPHRRERRADRRRTRPGRARGGRRGRRADHRRGPGAGRVRRTRARRAHRRGRDHADRERRGSGDPHSGPRVAGGGLRPRHRLPHGRRRRL
ncbi:MAG: hypothetical protein AVDCRST_MAG65-520, partial [uncultured Solirubrobacteraceae bacterium]